MNPKCVNVPEKFFIDDAFFTFRTKKEYKKTDQKLIKKGQKMHQKKKKGPEKVRKWEN